WMASKPKASLGEGIGLWSENARIDVHIYKALLWSPGRSSHFWNIQTPPNLKKTSAISRAGRDFIALSTHRPACGTANTSLIWGGCPRELLTSQCRDSGIEFPIPHLVRQLKDKWMEGIEYHGREACVGQCNIARNPLQISCRNAPWTTSDATR
ncbi:hypothetical protein EV363DRAFT_1334064, partial [Boletus edulis]